MIRFRTRTLLLAFVLVALWMSTFARYEAASDVRASILLLICVASGAAAIYGRGRRRAFWAAFFVVMLFCGGNDLRRPLNRYVPNFAWQWGRPNVYYPVPSPPMPVDPAINVSVSVKEAPPTIPAPAYAPPAYSFTPVQPLIRNPAIVATLAAIWSLTLATLCGVIVAFIYEQSRKTES